MWCVPINPPRTNTYAFYLISLAVETFLLWQKAKAVSRGSAAADTKRTVLSDIVSEEKIPVLSKKASSSSRQNASHATWNQMKEN